MKKTQRLIALTALITLLTNLGFTQEYGASVADIDMPTTAYSDSSSITSLSAYVPVAALILAALVLSRADGKARGFHSGSSSRSYHAHSGYSSYNNYSGYSDYSSYFPYSSYSGTGSYGSSSYSGYHSH
jgi:hypothetical protein